MANKKLLIIHQGALGDFILTFPAIIRLQKYYDVIETLCQSGIGNLAKKLGLVKKSYPLESAFLASLFSDQIDSKIKTFLSSYTTILLFTLSDQLERTIHQISSAVVCCIAPKPPKCECRHLAEFVLENLVNCGLIRKVDAVVDDIPLPKRTMQPVNFDKVLLHPGAGSIRKRWPITHFLEVEAILIADGLKPEFLLGPAEEDLVDELPEANGRVHILADLGELAELLNSAGGYIGNDSGATHLAAYLGVPTGVIFGPADPKRWKPMGRLVEIVRPELDCRPCFETEKSNCDSSRCLNETTAEKVIKAFYRVYPK